MLRRHRLIATAIAFVVAAVAVVAIAATWGFSSFARAWAQPHPGWLVLSIGASLLTFPAYVLAYRAIAAVHDGPNLRVSLVMRLVTAGFGPFAAQGGFALDKRALHAIEDDEHSATTRVLGLGALEWALLAPAAWACAVILLTTGARGPLPSLLWPWALAVPLGFAVGLWLAIPARRKRLERSDGRLRPRLGRVLRSVGILITLAGEFPSCWAAWAGAGLYWVFDIAAFYGAVAFIGLHLNLAQVVLGYATGYALTRRSMPLGGAGATEALMTFALHWVGAPVPGALAAVVLYRVFNFVLPTIPALIVHPVIDPLLRAADEGRTPARRERRAAAAPMGQLRGRGT